MNVVEVPYVCVDGVLKLSAFQSMPNIDPGFAELLYRHFYNENPTQEELMYYLKACSKWGGLFMPAKDYQELDCKIDMNKHKIWMDEYCWCFTAPAYPQHSLRLNMFTQMLQELMRVQHLEGLVRCIKKEKIADKEPSTTMSSDSTDVPPEKKKTKLPELSREEAMQEGIAIESFAQFLRMLGRAYGCARKVFKQGPAKQESHFKRTHSRIESALNDWTTSMVLNILDLKSKRGFIKALGYMFDPQKNNDPPNDQAQQEVYSCFTTSLRRLQDRGCPEATRVISDVKKTTRGGKHHKNNKQVGLQQAHEDQCNLGKTGTLDNQGTDFVEQ